MGTRADFYIGIGPSAEWIGSISHDGDPERDPRAAVAATSEHLFRNAVGKILSEHPGEPTRPDEGWPWPWPDSRTTDFAYAWCDDGVVRVSRFGYQWMPLDEYAAAGYPSGVYGIGRLTDAEVVDMTATRMTTDDLLAKSGLMFLKFRNGE